MNKEKTIPFNYDSYYFNQTDKEVSHVNKEGIWKAEILSSFVKDKTLSILEIGTGRGDVLFNLKHFMTKVGADISVEALNQQVRIYHDSYGVETELACLEENTVSKSDIKNGFRKFSNIWKNKHSNFFLILIDANKHLPFLDKIFDYVLLCDILEHVENPEKLLKKSANISEYMLLKIPIENAFLSRFSSRIHGIKYGANHPSGHIYCWNRKEISQLIHKAGLTVIDSRFIPTSGEFSRSMYFSKKLVFKSIYFLEKFLNTNGRISEILLGGNLFMHVKC